MEPYKLYIALYIFCFLSGCKKENTGTTPVVTLVAKWNLLSDYTSNHLAQMNTYIGVAGDYFDFRGRWKMLRQRRQPIRYTNVCDKKRYNHNH